LGDLEAHDPSLAVLVHRLLLRGEKPEAEDVPM